VDRGSIHVVGYHCDLFPEKYTQLTVKDIHAKGDELVMTGQIVITGTVFMIYLNNLL
jgi:hypothetical protein